MATDTKYAAVVARHEATRTIGPATALSLLMTSTRTGALAVGRRHRLFWAAGPTSTSLVAFVALGNEDVDSGTISNVILLSADAPTFEFVAAEGANYIAAHDDAGGSILYVTEVSK